MPRIKSFTKFLATENDTQNIGEKLAQAIHAIHDGAIIFLNGPLGAGKTTLMRGFLRAFDYRDKVKSPTFTLVEPYHIANHTIFHFDFYRVHDPKELAHIGIQEYFSSENICVIEWPENAGALLPAPDLTCYIAFAKEGREIKVEAHTLRGEEILKKL